MDFSESNLFQVFTDFNYQTYHIFLCPYKNINVSVLSRGRNESLELTDEELLVCGSAYCPSQLTAAAAADDISNSSAALEKNNFKVEHGQIYVLAGIYLGCSICAALLIAAFVDPISRSIEIRISYISVVYFFAEVFRLKLL
jgi:hypothetical protein